MKKKNIINFIIILFIYIFTPLLILFNQPLYNYKFVFLVVLAILIYLGLRFIGVKNEKLGITKKKWKESLKSIANFTIALIIVVLVLKTFKFQRFNPTETFSFYIFYIFISSPAQEFLYRGVFKYFESTKVISSKTALILSSVLYSFVHIMYRDIFLLTITLFIGLLWYVTYGKTNNLLGVTISHAVLGMATIALGFI